MFTAIDMATVVTSSNNLRSIQLYDLCLPSFQVNLAGPAVGVKPYSIFTLFTFAVASGLSHLYLGCETERETQW
jgi:hypothetical protein